jgi:hypothetical protein
MDFSAALAARICARGVIARDGREPRELGYGVQ